MNETQWRQELAKVVRAGLVSPEFERFFAVRLNPERAKISLTQLGLFISQRLLGLAFGKLSGDVREKKDSLSRV
jgi:hypothetical protein